MASIGKTLILLGAVLIVVGLLLVLGTKIPFLGRLPGDIVVKRDNFTLFLPLGTSVLISVLLTIILYLISKFR